MLTSETLQTVKSTAPLLAEQGEAITQLFYSKLFTHHPELKNIFNLTHQIQGEQPRALANAVFKYAQHIDGLDALGPMVKRIAHKHASLQVAPEHYPIVGRFLLEAIQEHLGLSVQDPVLKAWAEAYGQLATIFVDTESAIYEQNASKSGGWRGFRRMQIARIVEETDDIRSFYLLPEDGGPLADFLPGQYIGVRVQPEAHGLYAIRQYSLSDAPGQPHYRITVKAEALEVEQPGIVSHHLHRLQVGDILEIQPPTGDFVLPAEVEKPVLIAGGVGLTPLLSMLHSGIQQGRELSKWQLIQCCRNANHHLMKTSLQQLSLQHGFGYRVCYEEGMGADHKGYLDVGCLRHWLPAESDNTQVFCCGPKPFMRHVNTLLLQLGYVSEQLHYEVFGPDTLF